VHHRTRCTVRGNLSNDHVELSTVLGRELPSSPPSWFDGSPRMTVRPVTDASESELVSEDGFRSAGY
jgi:hypothetical protein